jgi:hypothetical protein
MTRLSFSLFLFCSVGDLRVDVINMVVNLWKLLDVHQKHFLLTMVRPVLELTLVTSQIHLLLFFFSFLPLLFDPLLLCQQQINQVEIRQAASDLYFNFLLREFTETKSFVHVEEKTIETIDKIANEGSANDSFTTLFIAKYLLFLSFFWFDAFDLLSHSLQFGELRQRQFCIFSTMSPLYSRLEEGSLFFFLFVCLFVWFAFCSFFLSTLFSCWASWVPCKRLRAAMKKDEALQFSI